MWPHSTDRLSVFPPREPTPVLALLSNPLALAAAREKSEGRNRLPQRCKAGCQSRHGGRILFSDVSTRRLESKADDHFTICREAKLCNPHS